MFFVQKQAVFVKWSLFLTKICFLKRYDGKSIDFLARQMANDLLNRYHLNEYFFFVIMRSISDVIIQML